MNSYTPSHDEQLQYDVLSSARVIAVVGMSDRPNRASHQIGRFLKAVGYTIYPVNPLVEMIGEDKVYATLAEVPEPIDIVDVFRRPEFLMGVVEEAIGAKAKVVWAQLGIADDEAAAKAREAGLEMIMDNCIKVTYNRLMRR